ncbi:hypothetical protein [Halostagnicola sp. A-GB9-2]|uniref:hypothetical protein n=1 Tax=Halostagnicola sp. A-GB9-2 TaxID=3048066 RepID=UPI0024C0D29B|nr:hypothetical protein [Halostagnicola sp. A-GB9-2]MDJ1431154.1 hypothetical protein [Halostagnicola sp. A-GB9-2]
MTEMTDEEVETEAEKIVRESLEMGDTGPITAVDGTCTICGDDAVWQDPETDEYLCGKHAKERFTDRHN